MSIDRCACGNYVDADFDAECYGNDDVCRCEKCREDDANCIDCGAAANQPCALSCPSRLP